MKNKNILLILFLLISLFYINLAIAEENQLLCLTNGEMVQFSLCNSNIQDYTCEGNSCQLCVKKLDSGVYCTANFNSCINLNCSSLTLNNQSLNNASNQSNNTNNQNSENQGNKIAYIVKDNSNNIILNTIQEAGYNVNIITASQLNSVDFSQYNLIIVNNDKFSSTEVGKIPVNNKPSVVINVENLDDFGWTLDRVAPSTTTQFPVPLIVGDRSSSITNGLGDSFVPYFIDISRSYKIYYLDGSKASGIKIIYGKSPDLTGKPKDGIISTVDKNITLRNNQKSQSRGVFFGITDTMHWNEQTKKAFKNSIIWALRGEDRDNDGFFSDTDCNDNNALINPNATEIPYDGIDQDCDGRDLNDLDNDGFIAVQAGGNDCNDNDVLIKPGASDPLKNCINDAPILIKNIPDQTWNEDQVKILNLNEFFSDPDGISLSFSVHDTSNENNIELIINGNNAIFTPKENWNGEDWIIFKASDGEKQVISNKIILKILPVNDAPIISLIEDIKAVEGSLIKINPQILDVEGDNFTISYSLKFNSNGEWQTTTGDAGIYTIIINVNDGKGGVETSQFKVEVIEKLFVNEFLSDGDEWIELYNPGNQEVDLSGFTLEDNTGNKKDLSGKIPPRGFLAVENLGFQLNNNGDIIILKLNDEEVNKVVYGNFDDGNIEDNILTPGAGKSAGRSPDGSENWQEFERPTKGLSYDADVYQPIVELISPSFGEIFTEFRDILFRFIATDNTQELECGIYTNVNGNFAYLNPKRVLNNTEGNITINNVLDGVYIWTVRCSDGVNTAFALENRTFAISAPDAPIINPVGVKSVKENQTLEFIVSASDQDNDLIDITTEKLPQGAKFNSTTNIFSWIPSFSDSGSHEAIFIARDSRNNSDREIVKINVIDVEHFSFEDADTCKIFDDDIKITINDPDDNDEFEIGEKINIEIKIKNNADEDVDLNVKVYLYDLTEEEVIEDIDDDLEIDEDDTEEIEFEIEIPNDIDVDNKNAIYVIAKEDEDEFCNSEFVKIKVERADDKVIIDDVVLQPDIARKNENVNARIKVKNIGEDDQDDVYVSLFNSDLGLNLKSENFELEEFDEDDTQTINLNFKIPENATKTVYQLEVKVYYNGNVETKIVDLHVIDKIGEIIYTDIIDKSSDIDSEIVSLNGKTVDKVNDKKEDYKQTKSMEISNGSLMNSILKIIDIFLIIGIIFLIVLIIIVGVRNSRDEEVVVGKVMKFEKDENNRNKNENKDKTERRRK